MDNQHALLRGMARHNALYAWRMLPLVCRVARSAPFRAYAQRAACPAGCFILPLPRAVPQRLIGCCQRGSRLLRMGFLSAFSMELFIALPEHAIH